MNLQSHLLSRIVLVALLCLLATAAHVLFQAHRQAGHNTRQMAESLGKQLEAQILLIRAGIIGKTNPFPDFEAWKQSGAQPGICVAYLSADGKRSRSLCTGGAPIVALTPPLFVHAYRWLFEPGQASVRPLTVDGLGLGSLTVTPDAELEIAAAWQRLLELASLSAITVAVVCLLVYLIIEQTLRPAAAIVAGISTLESGRLDHRLPAFELREWRHIASAINRLAASQQQLLNDRQQLVVKLLALQEDERRDLARELHDEFGQCLAAINAVASSIKQSASGIDPGLATDAEQIGQISSHMLAMVRDLLARLRPAELDELGLAAGLNSLISAWNRRGGTFYRLNIEGDCAALPACQAEALYRIAQECLTNIAKHAAATQVGVDLVIGDESATLRVRDDGIARRLPFVGHDGIGLLGMRERVAALQGQLTLSIAEPSGLNVVVRLPRGEESTT